MSLKFFQTGKKYTQEATRSIKMYANVANEAKGRGLNGVLIGSL